MEEIKAKIARIRELIGGSIVARRGTPEQLADLLAWADGLPYTSEGTRDYNMEAYNRLLDLYIETFEEGEKIHEEAKVEGAKWAAQFIKIFDDAGLPLPDMTNV